MNIQDEKSKIIKFTQNRLERYEEETEIEGEIEQPEFTNIGQKTAYVAGILACTAILLTALLSQCHNYRMQEIQAQQAQHQTPKTK